jgi:hypothetical protein
LLGPEDKYPQWTPEVTDDDLLPPPKAALCALLPRPLQPRVLGCKGGDHKGRYLRRYGKTILVSKIGKTKGPKGTQANIPTKYPKFNIKPFIPSTPESLAAPANWDFTGMNPSTATLYLWSNIGLATDKVIIYDHYSSFFRVARILAYMLRTQRAPDNNPPHLWLKPEETHRALIRMILIQQLSTYGPELKHAIKHKYWPKNSKLAHLSPIVGPRGELRVGGRLKLLGLPCLKQLKALSIGGERKGREEEEDAIFNFGLSFHVF